MLVLVDLSMLSLNLIMMAVWGNYEYSSIDNEELGMSPKEIWSNEAQERYVLAIDAKDLEIFLKFVKEKVPF